MSKFTKTNAISIPMYQITASCEGEHNPVPDDACFFYNPVHFSAVIQKRVCSEIHPNAVAGQAIERYGVMIESTLEGMAGMLDESELLLMLDANPTSYWRYEVAIDLATTLVESYAGMLAKSSPIITLTNKLRRLSTSQQVALTDALERVWRNMDDEKSLMELAKEVGLLLKEHVSHLDEAD